MSTLAFWKQCWFRHGCPASPPDAPADIATITSWLAGVYRPSFGFHL
jgi:hypothetical protein